MNRTKLSPPYAAILESLFLNRTGRGETGDPSVSNMAHCQ